jgi:hypothetical protein
VREGELSQLSRRVAEREDEMMWAEFQERFFYNLGLVSREGGCQGGGAGLVCVVGEAGAKALGEGGLGLL